jgi:sucrose-6-phosphate hydrolase SacC (GH32 family)
MPTRSRSTIGVIILVLTSALCGAAGTVPATAATRTLYTMTSFSNNSDGTDNNLNMFAYTSTDGLNFTRIGTGAAYTPPAGILRDPSVIRNTADGRYYVAYTNKWSGNSIGLASSPDRANWTFLQNIPLGADLNIAWAPEWFKDTDGSYHIIVHLRHTGGTVPAPYVITSRNASLTAWTTPVALEGLSADYIDSYVVKLGSTYHIFAKNDVTKYIEHATSAKLTGPYTFVGTGDWAGWGAKREGPSLYRLDNGTWRVLLDGYKDKKYYYSDSADNFKSWTAKKELPGGLSGFVRHLTVLKEPGA